MNRERSIASTLTVVIAVIFLLAGMQIVAAVLVLSFEPDEPEPRARTTAEPETDEAQEHAVRQALDARAYVYLALREPAQARGVADGAAYTLVPGSVVLATAYEPEADDARLTIHFVTAEGVYVTASVPESEVRADLLTETDWFDRTDSLDYAPMRIDGRQMNVFAVGEAPAAGKGE